MTQAPRRARFMREKGGTMTRTLMLAMRVAACLPLKEAAAAKVGPPAVLAHGRFPPLTQWQVEHPPADVSGRQEHKW